MNIDIIAKIILDKRKNSDAEIDIRKNNIEYFESLINKIYDIFPFDQSCKEIIDELLKIKMDFKRARTKIPAMKVFQTLSKACVLLEHRK